MKPGSFDLVLLPETPKYIRDLLLPFGHILVYDAPVDPRIVADGDILAGSLYCGILRRKPNPFSVAGVHITSWLGDDEGKGDLFESNLVVTAQGFVAAVTAALPPNGGVVAGTITAPNFITAGINPGFETTGGWLLNLTGTGAGNLQDAAAPHSGTKSLSLTNPSAGNYGGVFSTQGIPVAGLSNIYYEFWGKAGVGGATGPFRITFANPGTNVGTNGVATAQPSAQAAIATSDVNWTATAAYQKFSG